MLRTGLILLGCLLVASCSTRLPDPVALDPEALQQEQQRQWQQALQYQTTLRDRLQQIAYPVLRAASPLCHTRQRFSLGLILHQRYAYPEPQQEAAERLFGDLQQPSVRYVIRGSAADEIIRPGDRLLAINGRDIRPTLDDTRQRLRTAVADGSRVTLSLERQGQDYEAVLIPQSICDYPVHYSNSDRVNGFADGRQIRITAGMVRFAEADEELAFIVAHELAHNLLRHNAREVTRLSLGGLLDLLLASSGIPSPGIAMGLAGNLGLEAFESEADMLGIHLVADTGMPIDGLAEFWRRLATRYPESIHSEGISTHPGTAERYLRMRHEIKQLQQDR